MEKAPVPLFANKEIWYLGFHHVTNLVADTRHEHRFVIPLHSSAPSMIVAGLVFFLVLDQRVDPAVEPLLKRVLLIELVIGEIAVASLLLVHAKSGVVIVILRPEFIHRELVAVPVAIPPAVVVSHDPPI